MHARFLGTLKTKSINLYRKFKDTLATRIEQTNEQ